MNQLKLQKSRYLPTKQKARLWQKMRQSLSTTLPADRKKSRQSNIFFDSSLRTNYRRHNGDVKKFIDCSQYSVGTAKTQNWSSKRKKFYFAQLCGFASLATFTALLSWEISYLLQRGKNFKITILIFTLILF